MNTETDEKDVFDLDAAMEDIAGEMDLPDDDTLQPETPSLPEAPPAAAEPAPTETPVDGNAPEVQALGAPDTWTKEAIAEWATIPPRVKEEILKRERDMVQGIESYKGRATLGDAFQQIVEPHIPLMQQYNLGVPEVQTMLANMLGNHVALHRAPPQDKLKIALGVLQGYGIDPVELALAAGGKQAEPQNPELAALRSELGQVRETLAQRERREAEAAQASALQQVEAFANDPEHPYYREVENDILHLLSTGAAPSLQKAYEMAVWNNPATREKEMARLAAATAAPAPQPRPDPRAAALAANVDPTPHPGNGAVPVGSMDDTLRETLESIRSR